MGLSIHPGGASWAYSGFNAFRTALAAEEGIELDAMEGFGGEQRPWQTPDGQPISPLVPLLHHSDCDGYLESYECEQVVPRLEAILTRWESDGRTVYDPHREYDIAQGRRLLAAMRHSIEHGCAVVFG